MSKKQEDQTQFLKKRGSIKRKMDSLYCQPEISHQLMCYKTIDSPILQEFFFLSQDMHHAMQKKR